MQNQLFPVNGGVISKGSMSILSREENHNHNHNHNIDMVMISSEESASYPDESELELGLGLSLGVGSAKAKTKTPAPDSWDQYARILTAKYFTSPVVSDKISLSSSSSSSSVTRANNNGSCGTKRTAEPSSPPGRSAVSQVVGWPPIRNYRMNSLVNHSKSPATEELISNVDKCESKNIVVEKISYDGNRNKNAAKKTSLFVKVNMDGIPIGRKVDLNAHSGYETLAHTLDEMFNPSTAVGEKGTNKEEPLVMAATRQPLRLFNGSSDFVLTYEDKEGDWMLVGDVPWEMFLSSVRRLRIMRTAEVNGIGPTSHESNRRNLTTPI